MRFIVQKAEVNEQLLNQELTNTTRVFSHRDPGSFKRNAKPYCVVHVRKNDGDHHF